MNCICPGYVLSDRVRERFAASDAAGRPSTEEELRRRHPYGVGEPIDIARIALFLASEESRMITGAAIPADGGMSYH